MKTSIDSYQRRSHWPSLFFDNFSKLFKLVILIRVRKPYNAILGKNNDRYDTSP